MTTRIVSMGSPEFAIPTLRALAENYTIAGVVTQPDRPAGRGRALTPPPVKTLALQLGIDVIQPRRLREPEAMDQLTRWAPDLIVVAAFGQILRPAVLDLPPYGCINVHASLLPRWRGAAPIQAAILHSDEQTGVTIMRMDPGIDTGPILAQQPLTIDPADTAATLSERLAQLGASLLVETLPPYLSGKLAPRPQDETGSPFGPPTYAPMLKKEDGQLDFSQPAEALARRVRAFNPWPGAFTPWQGQVLKIHAAHAVRAERPEPTPGSTVVYQGQPAIAATGGLLVLDVVQPAGKKPMPGKAFLAGARGWGSH
ncbi:MAG: methionyl-tRNA formyltransferase [Chloroflexota bacterium]|nr:MAG: methionyl-tRNA formyltransferase [Chloroflexota bacterium]